MDDLVAHIFDREILPDKLLVIVVKATMSEVATFMFLEDSLVNVYPNRNSKI